MLRKNALTFLWASAANPLLVALLVAIFSKKKTKKPVSSSKQSKKKRHSRHFVAAACTCRLNKTVHSRSLFDARFDFRACAAMKSG